MNVGKEIQMRGNGGSADQRQARRYRLRGEATARPLETDITMPGRVIDLSAQGCLLMVPSLTGFEIGTIVDMSVSTDTVTFRALGRVRHRAPDHWRLGVSFVDLSRRGKSELSQLIEVLEEAAQQGRPTMCEVTVLRVAEYPPLKRFSPID